MLSFLSAVFVAFLVGVAYTWSVEIAGLMAGCAGVGLLWAKVYQEQLEVENVKSLKGLCAKKKQWPGGMTVVELEAEGVYMNDTLEPVTMVEPARTYVVHPRDTVILRDGDKLQLP